jgi:IS1 family transposase
MYVARKKKKVWHLYTYCHQTDEVLAFTRGERSSKTARNLLLKLKEIETADI